MAVRREWPILLICAILSGCLAHPVPVPFPAPRVASLPELDDLYEKRRHAIGDFKGRLTVALSSPRLGRQTFHATWYFEHGTTTLRGFNLFGQSLFRMTLSDSAVSFVPARGEPIQWRRTDTRQPALAIPSFELIDGVNTAGVPDLSDAPVHTFEKMGEMFHLAVGVRNGITILHQIEPTDFHVTKTERFDAAGQIESTVTFDDYRKIGTSREGAPIDFPFVVTGTTEAGTATLIFKEVSLLEP